MASIVVITSSQLRHHYFVNVLSGKHELVALIIEDTPSATTGRQEESALISSHFSARREREQYYFGTVPSIPAPVMLRLSYGGANDPYVVDVLGRLEFDYIVLYGSSIIREPLLTLYENRIINMHLGLSPYYRGTATNFWPLANREPQCVGVTIHRAVLKVDAGNILAQTRPHISLEDRCHDYGCKAIIGGTVLMSDVLAELAKEGQKDVSQQCTGRLYRTKDFNEQALYTMLQNFESGMNEEYLAEKDSIDALYPIVSLK